VKQDQNWPRASVWLAGNHFPDPVATIAVLGAPIKLGSISGGRFDLAPRAIRGSLDGFATYDAQTGVDLRTVAVRDSGDLPLEELRPEEALEPIADAVGAAVADADAVILLGGENSITRPGARGLGDELSHSAVLTLDAHHDLRDTSGGLSNGNPIRALLQDGLSGESIAQIGVQPFANSEAYAEVARDAGILVVTADEVRARGIATVVEEALGVLSLRADSIYVDLDLDVLDRAFAPACPGSRPGGLAPWELLTAARLCGVHEKVRAVDLVEVDPVRDVADVTVLTAAKCLLSFAAGLAARRKEGS
jgi:formiminoglutamase